MLLCAGQEARRGNDVRGGRGYDQAEGAVLIVALYFGAFVTYYFLVGTASGAARRRLSGYRDVDISLE